MRNSLKKIIKDILVFSPRQLENELKTAHYILSVLEKHKIDYKLEEFVTYIPDFQKYYLFADGKKIKAEPCCFKSGFLKSKYNLISSLISSQVFIDKPNLNFNPECEGMSLSNFYFAPAFALSRGEVDKVLKAQKVSGYVKVKKIRHKTFNILVGNIKNPKTISFAHFDSIKKGAIDNASGTSVLLQTVISFPNFLKENLFVFSANEEISYDYPVYWGHGFRVFEKEYFKLLKNCKKILVVDCVGNGNVQENKDLDLVKLGFPIENIKKFKGKTSLIHSDMEDLMKVYHSELDTIDKLSDRFLEQSLLFFIKVIEN